MAGLGATLITFSPNTVIRSADVNSNLSALNGVSSPSFTTITVSGLATIGHLSSDAGKFTSDGNGNVTITGNLSVSGTVTGGSSGGSTFTGTVAFKPSSGDAYTVYSTAGTLGLAAGYNSSGTVGGYLYDEVNAGYVYQGATKSGITFTGTVTAGGFTTSGSISIGSTLYGPGQTNYIQFAANPWDIIIAPGSSNWTYFNAAKNAHVDSGGNFSGAGVSVSGGVSASGNVSGGSATFGASSNYGSSSSPVVSFNLGYSNLIFWGDGGAHYIATSNAGTYSRNLVLSVYNGSSIVTSAVFTPGGIQLGGDLLQSGSSILGFKNSGGGKFAEMKGDGSFIIAGGTYWTATSTYAYSANGSFDAFDYAETYPLDGTYESGTVVCPGPHETFTRCTHDNCHAATVVSLTPAFCAGGGTFDRFNDDERENVPADDYAAPLALVGRVRIRTTDVIRAGDLVCSDGKGGVRRARPGEEAFTLGYALHATHNGQVGVYLRPLWCRVPQRRAA